LKHATILHRRIRLLAAISVIAAVAIPVTAASTAGASGSSAKLMLRHTSRGTILVNSRGYTLYAFTRDTRNHDACVRITGCLTAWPAVVSGGTPIAGPGVRRSLIGTIPLRRGVRQVTYAGWPLYTYINDFSPGTTVNINILQFTGRWPALNAAGRFVR
jgi:predicted lipoprotein with Yx(FWY)xxD motif